MQPVEETGPSDPQTPTLPVLQSLEIDSIKLAILITYIVTRTHMPALVELAVNLVNITKVEGEALLSLLQDRNPSMKKLQLTGDALNLTTRGFFTQLRDLELCAPIDTYTSECLERIIKSNPQMTRLVTYNTTQPRTRPTLNTSFLETVAQACVDMLEIRVPLDTLDFPWAAEEKTPPAQLERLKDLVLDPLHIQPDAMAPFARYLTRLCPVLETFETTTLHPGLGPGIPTPEAPTQEEVDNSKLMENLVYEAQVDNSE
ncbi:hypothetical protein FRB90_002139 [Tulasnella sp. 427]|nr:hypothetical protein FRB90_002139 [Tulasnella sp. 427]